MKRLAVPQKGKKVLLAIGFRDLRKWVEPLKESGAEVFVRIFPSADGIREALSCGIKEDNIAVFRPASGELCGAIESALCRKWSINCLICRCSGGITQKIWKDICKEQRISLYMFPKPTCPNEMIIVNNTYELVDKLSSLE